MYDIGPICREWRISRGITQTHIAQKANVSRSLVSKFEAGGLKSNRLLYTYIICGFPISYRGLLAYLKGGDDHGEKKEE